MIDKTLFALVQRKRFLGLPLYEKYRTDDQLVRLFVGGLWREDVSFSAYGETSRVVSLFGFPLWGRKIKNGTLSWYLGRGIEISRLDIAEILEQDLNKLFGGASQLESRRNVFVLWANSGEIAMLFSIFMPRLFNKMRLEPKDVVFLCTKRYHADMADLYYPDVKAVIAKPKILRHVAHNLKTKSWNVKIFFTGAYFCEFERQAKRSNIPLDCIDWMGHYLDLPPKVTSLSCDLNKRLDSFEKAADSKVDNIIDWSKTIIISPTSFSCGSLSVEDTSAIHDMIVERGYEVFFNESSGERSLSFPELLSKVRHSAGVIGIRSGLIDFLNIAKVPMLILYKSFQDRGFNTPACSQEMVLRMFSLDRSEEGSHITELFADPKIDLNQVSIWLDSLDRR